jgi:hypothetical protein
VKIVVIGGTGLIGSKLVKTLRGHGHQAVPASPDTGVNTLTGEGLAEALDGAAVVVDVSNSPSFEDAAAMQFFQTSTANLLDAEAIADVGHHVALSVVGTERLSESGYIGQERPGETDQGIADPLLDRPRDAVLRVHQRHRRRRNRRQYGATRTRPDPADRGRRRRECARQDLRRAAGERHRRSSGSTTVPPRRTHPTSPRGTRRPTRSATGSTRDLLRRRTERAHPPPRR